MPGPRDGLDLDREHVVRAGRAVPVRADVRAGRGRRARDGFGRIRAGAPVHARPRRRRRAPVRRGDRRDRARRRVLRLGGGGARHAHRRDGGHRDAGRGRRPVRRSAHRDERAAGRRGGRPALDRRLVGRDDRGAGRAGLTAAARDPRRDAPGRTARLGGPGWGRADRPVRPVHARDRAARHADRAGRLRRRWGAPHP